jgi:antitoxin component of MazEF toxin-antitoxin module
MNFSFEQRKIQKVKYTHLLPIPADWIKNMNICKGDSLNIEMLEDNSLRIIPN